MDDWQLKAVTVVQLERLKINGCVFCVKSLVFVKRTGYGTVKTVPEPATL